MANILIINHQPTLNARLQTMLEQTGHKVSAIAQTTPDALLLLETEQTDIIYLDLGFGQDHDRPQLAQIASEKADTKLVYIISNAGQTAAKIARQTEADAYLIYPFDTQDVYLSLTTALSPGQAAAPPAILQELFEQDETTTWNQLPEKSLVQVHIYVRENLDKEITLKSMASIAGMSESNFSRRFKASMKITPYQYVLQERLEEAKYMLRHLDISLVHIAAATGFSSQSHFSTVFRKHTQLTPLQFRRQ